MKKEPTPNPVAAHSFSAATSYPNPDESAAEDAPFGPGNPPPDNITLTYLTYLEPSRIERFMSLQQRAEEDKTARQRAIVRASQGDKEGKPSLVAAA